MADSSPDLTGRVCVVTGATRGIGLETARGLARMGGRLVLIARRLDDGRAAAEAIGGAAVVQADLASQASIRRAAAEVLDRHPAIHVLVNNAGVITRQRTETVDGIETQFAVNHLAYFLLTTLLLPALRAGAPSRIVNVASEAHHGARIDFDDLQGTRRYSPNRAYAQSKLANILFTYELARRLEDTGVTVNCCHPGVIGTRLLADFMGVPFVGPALARGIGGTPEEGARTSIWLASAPELEGVTGKYFIRRREARSSPESYDRETAERLWAVSEQLVARSADPETRPAPTA